MTAHAGGGWWLPLSLTLGYLSKRASKASIPRGSLAGKMDRAADPQRHMVGWLLEKKKTRLEDWDKEICREEVDLGLPGR